MSMPHECACRVCGGLMSPQFLTLTAEQTAAQRAVGARALASAIFKIAPTEARKIAERWQEIVGDERRALDEFLTFLRSAETQESKS